MAFFTSAQDFFVSNSQSKKKNQINSKILCPQSPSFLVLRPRRLREAKSAMVTKMFVLHKNERILESRMSFLLIIHKMKLPQRVFMSKSFYVRRGNLY